MGHILVTSLRILRIVDLDSDAGSELWFWFKKVLRCLRCAVVHSMTHIDLVCQKRGEGIQHRRTWK